jgi:hypothetical protein
MPFVWSLKSSYVISHHREHSCEISKMRTKQRQPNPVYLPAHNQLVLILGALRTNTQIQ